MDMTVEIDIEAPIEKVWHVITDIENAADWMASILSTEVLEPGDDSLVGLKWKETREMFGKEASEIMWITEAEENSYYTTRAESHGSIYVTKLSLTPSDNSVKLAMTFNGKPVSLLAKIMYILMMPFFKGSMKKELQKDLQDIKIAVES